MDWSLKGRSVRNMPKPSNDFLEGGIVAIKIKVDQFGKVISAEFTPKGSTSTDSHLKKLAVQAALKCRFNVNKNAPETQQGVIKYRFTVGG
jgi:TonB family protein